MYDVVRDNDGTFQRFCESLSFCLMVGRGVSEWSVKAILAKHLNDVRSDEKTYRSRRIVASPSQDFQEYQILVADDDIDHIVSECHDDGNGFIIKPDMLIKRRAKLGLVRRSLNLQQSLEMIREFSKNPFKIGDTEGYLTDWIVEPFIEHDLEYYICISSHRSYDLLLFSKDGGINIGDVESKASRLEIPFSPKEFVMSCEMSNKLFKEVDDDIRKILEMFVVKLYNAFVKLNFQFLEINPFTIVDSNVHILDCAAKVDICARFICQEDWKINDKHSLQFIPMFGKQLCETEKYIEKLDSMTGASLKFTLINPSAKIWMLIAGGGASVVYADTICDLGYPHELANYGEYSGAPKTHEIYEYTRSILKLMLTNEIRQDGKILLIGGGIANFTNVGSTFDGIIMALEEFNEKLLEHKVKIFVRRGGPNYAQGLKKISDAGKRLFLDIKVFGPDIHMTSIVSMALLDNQPQYLNLFNSSLKNDQKDHIIHDKDNHPFQHLEKEPFYSSYFITDQINSKILKTSFEDNENLHTDKDSQVSHVNRLDLNNFMSKNSYVFFIGFDQRAIQSMLDFDYKCGRPASVLAIVDPFQSEHQEMFFMCDELIHLPVYKTIDKALEKHEKLNFCINMASMRSCYRTTHDIIKKHSKQIKNILIVAEGVPDNHTRHLIALSKEFEVTILGPATVGAIRPGHLKLANTAGAADQLTALRLHSPGSVGIVTKSGGLSNEISNIVSRCTDGVFSCIAIGGDRYPCLQLVDCVQMLEKEHDCRIIMLIGEIGGHHELDIVEMLKQGLITKPIIAWCIGTSAGLFKTDIQFGHAGAYADKENEKATRKNEILRQAGAYVPDSFEQIPELLTRIYQQEINSGRLIPTSLLPNKDLPLDYSVAKSMGFIRKKPSMQTSIFDDRSTEVMYNDLPLKQILERPNSIGMSISSLWFKKVMPDWALEFIEICLTITADHGPCVSGAHNTIIASRAGKDMVSSVASGILTIGSRFGGAMDEAAHDFYFAHKNKISPYEFVEKKKKNGKRVMGIGHAVKSVYNPDSRVNFIVDYVHKKFPSHNILDFALDVSNILLQRKHNLILNVDGAIGSAVVDMMLSLTDMYSIDEIELLIYNGLVNGFFILSRTIGLIGHFLDQKRLNQGLYRHPWDDISKINL